MSTIEQRIQKLEDTTKKAGCTRLVGIVTDNGKSTGKIISATYSTPTGGTRPARASEVLKLNHIALSMKEFMKERGIDAAEMFNSPELQAEYEKVRTILLFKAKGGRVLPGKTYTH
jgi:hypothetical protein